MKCLLPTAILIAYITINQASKLESNLNGCATPYQKENIDDFFPDKLTPTYAKTFNITYHGTYKVLSNIATDESYLLYQCGTNPPQDEIDSGKYRVVTSIPLPDGIALTTTVQIPMFELLGLSDEIKTYIGDTLYISSPCLVDRIADGTLEVVASNEITNIPSDTGTALWAYQWESKYPERIIIDNNFMTSAGQGTDKTITENAYLEGPSKARFEWLFFYATLYNKEKLASRIASETEQRYDCTAQNAYNDLSENDASKPTAVWAYFSNYPGYEGWLIGTCDPKYNYYCEYSDACNINLLHTNITMTDEQFEEFAKDADIFFYSSDSWNDVYDSKKDMLDKFKSVKNKQVFDHELSGEYTWWEQRMAEYDIVLEDFCTVANMTTDLNQHQRHYLRNVFYEQVGEMELNKLCDPGVPLESRATECTLLAKPSTVDSNRISGTSSGGVTWNLQTNLVLSFIACFFFFLLL